MENKLVKIAKQYLKAGFSVIPVSSTKQPTIPQWSKFMINPMTEEEAEKYFAEAQNIALLCGGSSRVVCLDADMKYDLSGDLWERFKEAVPKRILKKLMCQSTQNKGFHLVFIAPASRLAGNEKFASRYTTPYEKHITYMEAFNNPKLRDKALNIALQDKSRILFESRSGTEKQAGGYFLIAPSKGYKILYGKIQELNEEEYDILIETARSFNEVLIEDKPLKEGDYYVKWEVSPFEHYNKEGDVVQLLVDHGWEVIYNQGNNVRFKRPGTTHSKSSALFDASTRVFNVFSTSVSFDVGRGYTPSSVFMHLEADDDSTLGYKKLIELGYGIK